MAAWKPTIQVIPNLAQGVSQQAPQQRRDTQCEEQFDCINSASEGCDARPATELVKVWAGRDLTGAFFQELVYEEENYVLGFDTGEGLFAINLATGDDCSITDPGAVGTSYLSSGAGDPEEKLKGHTSEDYSFIANRKVTTAMASTTAAAKVNEALIFLRSTDYTKNYKIDLTGPATVNAVTKTGDTAPLPGTEAFLALLLAQINGINGYSATQSGSIMRIYRGDGQAFTVTTSDDSGDDVLLAFNGEAQSYEKLPDRGFNGMVIKVRGDRRVDNDDFYVKWVGSPSTGNWQEVVGPGVKTTIDAATMPHALVRTAPNTFEWRRPTWSTRIAGDETTAKNPGFIGKAVRDVFYHQRRLALLHLSGAVFSKTDAPFTFLPDTVQTVLDNAPVDVKVSSTSGKGTNNLEFAVQVQENLHLWAQLQQYRVSHGTGEGFSQKTVSSDESSAYEFAPAVDPLALGPFLLFVTDNGQHFTFRALQFSQTKLLGDVDLGSHVPTYLRAGAKRIAGSETLRTVFIQTEADADILYVFNYLWDGEKFVQQAFNTWRLPGGDVLWTSVKGNLLRILQQRPEGLAYLTVNLTPAITDGGVGDRYQTRLDLRVDETKVTGLTYDAVTNTSSFTLPYTPTGTDVRVVTRVDKADGYTRGRVFELVSVAGAVVTVKGNLTGYQFYVGQRISAERLESEFFIRTENGSEPTDHLTVNKWSTTLSETGYTRLQVEVNGVVKNRYVFEGRELGDQTAVTGTPIPRNGHVEADVAEYSKDVKVRLVNDSFLPSRWQNSAVDYTAVGWKGIN